MSLSNFSKAAVAGLALAVGLSSLPETAQAQAPALTPLPSNIEPASCKAYFRTQAKIDKNNDSSVGSAIGNIGGAALSDLISGKSTLGRQVEREGRKAADKQADNAALRYELSQQEGACVKERQQLVRPGGACFNVLTGANPLSKSEQKLLGSCSSVRDVLGLAATPAPSAPGALNNCQNATVSGQAVLLCDGQNGQKVIVQLKP